MILLAKIIKSHTVEALNQSKSSFTVFFQRNIMFVDQENIITVITETHKQITMQHYKCTALIELKNVE